MNTHSILVVDDMPENFEVIEALLEGMNYTLHYASGGQEAIDSLDKFSPDLILLDVMMPEINGIEACKQIKAIQRWQSIPIIMVTSLSSTNDLANCLTAGADDFLSKPVNGVELRARVNSMLRIKKQHDRIESLSKLQRNNISFLKSSLDELNSDLAVSFPTASDAPLHNVLDKIQMLQQDLDQMTAPRVREVLASVNQSAVELDQFHQSFLFSRQLSLSLPAAHKQQSCAAKASIEQIVTRQVDQSQSLPKLVFDIEDADLAVMPKHLQYLISELLDYIIGISQAKDLVSIYGRVINDEFHVYIDNRGTSISAIPLAELSASIKFNSASSSDHELSIGLKIAKKTIEIYEGLFLIENANPAGATVYFTLPLVKSMMKAKTLVKISSATNDSNSISDELQESWRE